MIKLHEFNSNWLGIYAGFLNIADFFTLPKEERENLLNSYQWVEYRTSDQTPEQYYTISESNFYYVDTQVMFNLDLQNIKKDSSVEDIEVKSFTDLPFSLQLNEIVSFKSERFSSLPYVSQEKINKRYIDYAQTLISSYPTLCLQILWRGETQGWYFARSVDGRIELSLAMLHKNSSIRGKQLYKSALLFYKEYFPSAFSRFSIRNLGVHNILSQFGAHFLGPETVWFWINKNKENSFYGTISTESHTAKCS